MTLKMLLEWIACAPVLPALSTLLGSNICVRQVSPVAVAPLGIPSAKASTPAWSASPGDSYSLFKVRAKGKGFRSAGKALQTMMLARCRRHGIQLLHGRVHAWDTVSVCNLEEVVNIQAGPPASKTSSGGVGS